MARLHRIWYIDELVLTIFEQCPLSSAAALARTCWRMYRIGTPLIWASPPLSALISLVEADDELEPVSSKTRIRRSRRRSKNSARAKAVFPPTRLQFLAPWITDLVLVDTIRDENLAIETLMEVVTQYPTESLFTRLQTLVIIALSADFLDTISKFTKTDLAWIKVFLKPPLVDDQDDPESGYESFLSQLCAMSRLDSLTLYGSDTTAEAERHFISAVLQRFPELDTFDAWRMQTDTEFFRTLSNASQLAHLRIQLGGLPDRTELGTVSLPNLETLIVEYGSNTDLQNLLSSLEAPLLYLIQLDFHDTVEIVDYELNDTTGFTSKAYQLIVQRIASSWSKTLEELTISRLGPIRTHAATHRMWGFDTIRPLLSCHQMRKFQIPPAVRVRVNGADLIQLGKSWPRIRELSLAGFGSPVEQNAWVGVEPFFTFLGACRELELLELSVRLERAPDIVPDIDNPPEAVALCYDSPLRELSVHDCPAVDVDYTAKLLRRLFPKLERFHYARRGVMTWTGHRPWDIDRVLCMRELTERLGVEWDGD
ncbi:hypothetical protein CALCODRAFT_194587 [Calocera cornea HHB12733]|uniref:F-box domain-containing protein n=1 Tax=Calocera cornea HHB12733 TaxID=1353952 RepID=A0A165HID1_9BASI|nr:hypothetical protein CALCODRAFT_194587 [Calocera cornea HHB12733]